MFNLSKRNEVQEILGRAEMKEHLRIDHKTTWIMGLRDHDGKESGTILLDEDQKIYKSQLSQKKIWIERERYCAFNRAVIKASFFDCLGKKQQRFPYLFRDAVFIPIDGPDCNPNTLWFNLFQVHDLKKWAANKSYSVLIMEDGTEWIIPRTCRSLRDQIEESIMEYLTFVDVLRMFDYTDKPLDISERNFQSLFLNDCYLRVLKRENSYPTEKIFLSLCERKVNGNQKPKRLMGTLEVDE